VRTDEIGVPFSVTVDSATNVTIRERDSKEQIRVDINEVASVVKQLTEGLGRCFCKVSCLPMLAPKVTRSEISCHHHVQPSFDKAPEWTVFILQLPRRLTSLNITRVLVLTRSSKAVFFLIHT
jgi:hypothetical protein